LEQQPEKPDQLSTGATQDSRVTANSERKITDPDRKTETEPGDAANPAVEAGSGDSASEASKVAPAETRPRRVKPLSSDSANEPGGTIIASLGKSGVVGKFEPPARSWNLPAGILAAQAGTGLQRPPSFSLYFMSEYRRDEIKYTGKPTLALQFPSPVQPFSVPDAPIHFVPSAFEPNDEQFVGYVSAAVRDLSAGRLSIDTQISFRYSADLDGSTEASTFLGIRDNFVGRRIFEPLTFFADVKGLLPADSESKVSLRLGRQYAYGATPLRMDGATLSINHPRFSLDVFGGRRVTFYSDPEQRLVLGQNFLFRANEQTTIRYDFLHYIDNAHTLAVTHRLGESWILNGSLFFIDADPVDLNLGTTWVSPGSRTRVTFNFLQKLTDNDFIYDQTYRAFAQNPENQIRFRFFPLPPTGQGFDGAGRLNLGPVDPYTQFYVDGYRNLTSKVGIGGTVWVRQVNSSEDEGPFDNSFQEYRVNADYYPSSAFETGAEYRYRHLSRENAEEATSFFDIGREGEKTFHEVYANGAYHILSTLTLEGGVFYRRFNTQSRLISLEGMDTTGYTAGLRWRVARDYKLSLEYGFDRELAFLNPDIDYTQGFRVRFEWRFSR
ncbi:MAG TPA: hypothetical protein VLU47_04370, partial [Blastocatellia bacterium]|nr:hypothetical protein [Blastocatellia bacterium]